jgi:hypothetical protein
LGVQQPVGDDSEGEPLPAKEVELMVEPVHGLAVLPEVIGVTVGLGTEVIGLRPLPVVSVEPSGIAPPSSVNVEVMPGVDVWKELALVDEDVQPAVGVADPFAVIPPPSNVEEVVVAELVLLDPGCMFDVQVEVATGPRPPGDSSVAPSGMPVPLGLLVPLEPNVPNGEVAPMAGVIAVCAAAAWRLQRNASAAISNICGFDAAPIDRFMAGPRD